MRPLSRVFSSWLLALALLLLWPAALAAQSGAVQNGAAKAEGGLVETAQAEANKAESSQAERSQAEASQESNSQSAATQIEASPAEISQAEISGREAPSEPAPLAKTVVLLSGLAQGRGAALGELLARELPGALDSPAILKNYPNSEGVRAASLLSVAEPDGLTLGLLTAEAAITRELALASPFSFGELSGRLIAFEEPWAIIASSGAPFGNLSELAASKKNPVFGHAGLEPPRLASIQALGLFKSMGLGVQAKWVPDLKPDNLNIAPGDPSHVDVLAWPLSASRDLIEKSSGIKIVAVLADSYDGPCAPASLALSSQGQKAPARSLIALYERSGPRAQGSDSAFEAAAAILSGDEARSLMDSDCLIPIEPDLEGSQKRLEEERQAQSLLLRELGLLPDE